MYLFAAGFPSYQQLWGSVRVSHAEARFRVYADQACIRNLGPRPIPCQDDICGLQIAMDDLYHRQEHKKCHVSGHRVWQGWATPHLMLLSHQIIVLSRLCCEMNFAGKCNELEECIVSEHVFKCDMRSLSYVI